MRVDVVLKSIHGQLSKPTDIFTAFDRRNSRSTIAEHHSLPRRRQWRPDKKLVEPFMQNHKSTPVKIRPTPVSTEDAEVVRLGGESPSFGPVRVAPANTKDNGKVRLGGEGPSFGSTRVQAQ
jgi:hypothetical protein